MSGTASEVVSRERKGFLHFLREHVAHEWTSALLVTSLVTIAVSQFQWLQALETYAYLAIGHEVSRHAYETAAPASGASFSAIVVEIDRDAFEQTYQERSPLNRCFLKADLEKIYDARPQIVVVDLDLSPALLSGQERAVASTKPWNVCEDDLYTLILKKSADGIKTVLLDPNLTDTSSRRYPPYLLWKAHLAVNNVVFADAELPVSYGVLSSPSTNRDSIAAATSRLAKREPAERIDSRRLLTGLHLLSIRAAKAPVVPGHSETILQDALERWCIDDPESARVVFFGGAYGTDDVFVTALGEIYGVEAHAIAYVSDEVLHSEIVSFAADFVMAIIFSIAIAFFWGQYFDHRMSRRASVRELAKLWIMGLVASVLAVVCLFSYLSYKLLLHFGFWLSPIAIAVGMLIDSFVSGSVDQAVRKFHALRRKLQPEQHSELRVTFKEQIVIKTEVDQPPVGLHWGVRNLPRALGGEICELILDGKRFAVALLVLWTGLWISTLIIAIRAL